MPILVADLARLGFYRLPFPSPTFPPYIPRPQQQISTSPLADYSPCPTPALIQSDEKMVGEIPTDSIVLAAAKAIFVRCCNCLPPNPIFCSFVICPSHFWPSRFMPRTLSDDVNRKAATRRLFGEVTGFLPYKIEHVTPFSGFDIIISCRASLSFFLTPARLVSSLRLIRPFDQNTRNFLVFAFEAKWRTTWWDRH